MCCVALLICSASLAIRPTKRVTSLRRACNWKTQTRENPSLSKPSTFTADWRSVFIYRRLPRSVRISSTYHMPLLCTADKPLSAKKFLTTYCSCINCKWQQKCSTRISLNEPSMPTSLACLLYAISKGGSAVLACGAVASG